MEAFRDRTIKIDIPYNLRLSRTRSRSTRRTSTSKQVPGKHIAPHTLEIAAMWAILTRLEEPKKANLSLLQKLKLYNGKSIAGYTRDNIRELRDEAPREGMDGHLAALHPGQDLQRAGARHAVHQPVHGHERARGRPDHHSADLRPGDQEALQGPADRRARGVRGDHQERGAARDLGRRGGDLAAVRQLHRQRQGLHAEREGQEPVHRARRGAGRAADALDRGEDRDPGQRARTTSAARS